MTIRPVKVYSDRGHIKNLLTGAPTLEAKSEEPTNSELRLKKLYINAKENNNQQLLNHLGFITTDYIEDKSALPLSIYRLRKIVEDISIKNADKISKMKQDIDNCFFENEQHCLINNYLKVQASNYQRECFLKVASAVHSSDYNNHRSFWKASNKI